MLNLTAFIHAAFARFRTPFRGPGKIQSSLIYALLLLATLTGNEVGSFLDAHTHRHVLCVEHQEWVHAGELQGSQERDPGAVHHASQSVASEQTSVQSGEPGIGAEHVHCGLAVLSRSRPVAKLSSGSSETLALKLVQWVALDYRSFLVSGVPIYLFAPKNSPPTLA